MSLYQLISRSVLHYARSHIAVTLSCATACAIIAGALLVGDSVRGSLRDRSLERLGRVEWSLLAGRFFREELAADLARDPAISGSFEAPVPAILLRGTVIHAAPPHRRAANIQIVAVDERFGRMAEEWSGWKPEGHRAVVNERLAREISAREGDEILVHFQKASDVPREFALGGRTGTLERLRLELGPVRPDRGAALFDLRNQQETPRNVFVPLSLIQRYLELDERANALLMAAKSPPARPAADPRAAVRRAWKLSDIGLRLRREDDLNYLSLESEAFLIDETIADGARRAAGKAGAPYLEAFTYLANSMALGDARIPYSMVTALGPWTSPDGRREPALAVGAEADLGKAGGILLSSWAAEDLGAKTGDAIRLEYYTVSAGEELAETSRSFELRGTVELEGAAADPGWTPTYSGITDARTFSGWDPPFEIDHDRIRPRDEEYWRDHRTTPKAFLRLQDGQALWASRFGALTSVRVRPPAGRSLDETEAAFRKALLGILEPEVFGLRFDDVRKKALDSAGSGTDFAGLFIALSCFIIVSALLLVAATFRLALERRSRELGMLRALGYSKPQMRWLLLAEGMAVGIAGTAVGLAGGVAYAAALIAGLKSFWSGAVNAPFLALHVRPASLGIAALSTLALSGLTILLVLRRVVAISPSRLLAGAGFSGEEARARETGGAWSLRAGLALIVIGLLLFAGAQLELLPAVLGFVLEGACLFAGGLFVFAWSLRRPRAPGFRGPGAGALIRLGVQNGRRAAGRSLLTAGLIASATFIVVAVAASSHDPGSDRPEFHSGNGGFSVVATSAVPLFRPLGTEGGREDLNLGETTSALLGKPGAGSAAFRERPGDETSCLNLQKPLEPRILGAPEAFVRRGGFSWASSLAESAEEEENPWLLLERELAPAEAPPHEVIPAIGDQNTVLWILQSGLGKDIIMTDGRGQEVRLRLVGLLHRSIFQGALVISESRFLEHFPGNGGWSTFLFELGDEGDRGPLVAGLEKDLADFGMDAQTTGEFLASFQAVENTYLETFFVLGGLGLLLGTLGLGATLLRNVLERRGELALLRALGYSKLDLSWLVISESVWLLLFGMALGAAAGFLATLPNLLRTGSNVSWPLLAGTLALVLAAGLLSCLAALLSALRIPLLPALRAE